MALEGTALPVTFLLAAPGPRRVHRLGLLCLQRCRLSIILWILSSSSSTSLGPGPGSAARREDLYSLQDLSYVVLGEHEVRVQWSGLELLFHLLQHGHCCTAQSLVQKATVIITR